MPDLQAHLSISAEPKNLAVIRRFLEDTAAGWQADPEATLDLVQALDECATNVIVHGYRGAPGHLDIEVRREDNLLVVRLRDRAPPFDPTRVAAPDITLPLDTRPLGGMGVYLSRRLTDRMTYRVTERGENELTLARRAAFAPPRPPERPTTESG